MLSDLQRRVAEILAGLPEASDFVLAGGGALIARGDVDRLARDLDFFTVDPAQIDLLLPVLKDALQAAGWTVVEETVAAGFVRLVVDDGVERTGVDLATDARLLPVERSQLGLLLSADYSAMAGEATCVIYLWRRHVVEVRRLPSRCRRGRSELLAASRG